MYYLFRIQVNKDGTKSTDIKSSEDYKVLEYHYFDGMTTVYESTTIDYLIQIIVDLNGIIYKINKYKK